MTSAMRCELRTLNRCHGLACLAEISEVAYFTPRKHQKGTHNEKRTFRFVELLSRRRGDRSRFRRKYSDFATRFFPKV